MLHGRWRWPYDNDDDDGGGCDGVAVRVLCLLICFDYPNGINMVALTFGNNSTKMQEKSWCQERFLRTL